MDFSQNSIYLILFYTCIVVAFISFLICITSCCSMLNFCRGCLEMVAMTLGCMERDYLYYEDDYRCWDYNRYAFSQTRSMFSGCRIITYDPDLHLGGHLCCMNKRTICLNTSCTICLEDYIKGENLVSCPCGHCYHKDCIKSWLRIRNVCPMCKLRIGYRNLIDERTPLIQNPPV